MSLAEVLARDVDERTRVKGNRYFLGGAVRAIEGSDEHVTATVRGSEWYQVHLTRAGDEILASCGCPYFTDQNVFCKHIWAVILAADASGYLLGSRPLTSGTYLESAYTRPDRDSGNDARRAPSAPAPPLASWQRFLEGVRQRRAAAAALETADRVHVEQVVYELDRETSARELVPTVIVQARSRRKNGEWGKPQPLAISASELDRLPDETDRDILAQLLGASDLSTLAGYASNAARASFRIAGPLVARVIPALARSGRFYIRREPPADGDAAAPGPPTRSSRPGWRRGAVRRTGRRPGSGAAVMTTLGWDAGAPWIFELDVSLPTPQQIRVDGVLVRDGARVPLTVPDVVLSAGFVVLQGMVARLDARGALPWLVELRASGPATLPADAAPALMEAMSRSAVDPASLPEPIRYDVVEGAPRPRIRIARSSRARYGGADLLDAAIEFDYAGTRVSGPPEPGAYDAERRRMVRRDEGAERAALRRLQQLGFHQPWYFDAAASTLAIAVDRFPGVVRTLVEEGWHVEAEGRVFRAPQGTEMRIVSGVDWFELRGAVDFGDGRTASAGELLAAFKRGDATVVLDDGTRGMVPEEWLRRYGRIAEFGQPAGDHVRYQPSQAALLDALLEAQPAVSVDEAFARARQRLAGFSGIRALDPPAGFKGRLREYQREALGWFGFLREFGFGGCLADDMGLGKTVMVLALLESRRRGREPDAPRPSIAVVPRSLVFNWMDEAARFAPDLRILDYTGDARTLDGVERCDLVLTTYGTLRRDAARLTACGFDYVILDEAQAIKNATTAAAKAARLLRGRHRLALSGTPIENHLGELWSLFEFLNPGFLGPAAAFSRMTSGSARGDRIDLEMLARALRPFILRRTKAQVAPELPPKVEQTISCELESPQRKFYDELRAQYRRTLLSAVAHKGLGRSKLQVLEALLRLRQAASHPGLVDPARTEERSAKFDVLLSRLAEIADEGHKALVFSQFTSLLHLLEVRLAAEQITYEYLDGATRDRAARVARFESDDSCRVFLISLKAGGVGLNLTSAEYVFLLDPWWNPAVEAQAIDRAHRIGQTRPVFAYRLIARDTVEEKIAELQESKRGLAEAILSEDAGVLQTLGVEDLEWLLS